MGTKIKEKKEIKKEIKNSKIIKKEKKEVHLKASLNNM